MMPLKDENGTAQGFLKMLPWKRREMSGSPFSAYHSTCRRMSCSAASWMNRFRKAREGDNAAILDAEPPTPVRRVDVADVRHARIRLLADKIFGRGRHPPPNQCQLAAFGLISDDRGCVVREDGRHGLHVAGAVAHHAGPVANRLLVRRHRVEVAQGSALLTATCCASARQCRDELVAGRRGLTPRLRPQRPARRHFQTRAVGRSG